MEKLTIAQLLELSIVQRERYILTLPEAEQAKVIAELLEAITERDVMAAKKQTTAQR